MITVSNVSVQFGKRVLFNDVKCVRSSIAFYGNFNLDMDRSLGFGSTPTDYSPY